MDGAMQPLTAECEWYKLCLNGKYTARRCATAQLFNPTTNSCTDKFKLPVDGKCRSFKECLVIESVSPFGKSTELSCGPGQHFDQESQKCIEEKTATCGKYFQDFIFQINFEYRFYPLFSTVHHFIQICLRFNYSYYLNYFGKKRHIQKELLDGYLIMYFSKKNNI